MKKTLRFALCLLLTAALGLGCAAGALVYDPPAGDDSGEEETIPQYGKSLSGTIGAGQFVEFTTVASKFETDEATMPGSSPSRQQALSSSKPGASCT